MQGALDNLVTAAGRLHDDHASTKMKGDSAYLVQQVITSAYDIAKAAKQLMTTAESVYKN